MSGVVGDKQWQEFRKLEAEYIERFGEVDFTTIEMELDEIIATFRRALETGKPVYNDIPEGVLL